MIKEENHTIDTPGRNSSVPDGLDCPPGSLYGAAAAFLSESLFEAELSLLEVEIRVLGFIFKLLSLLAFFLVGLLCISLSVIEIFYGASTLLAGQLKLADGLAGSLVGVTVLSFCFLAFHIFVKYTAFRFGTKVKQVKRRHLDTLN